MEAPFLFLIFCTIIFQSFIIVVAYTCVFLHLLIKVDDHDNQDDEVEEDIK